MLYEITARTIPNTATHARNPQIKITQPEELFFDLFFIITFNQLNPPCPLLKKGIKPGMVTLLTFRQAQCLHYFSKKVLSSNGPINPGKDIPSDSIKKGIGFCFPIRGIISPILSMGTLIFPAIGLKVGFAIAI